MQPMLFDTRPAGRDLTRGPARHAERAAIRMEDFGEILEAVATHPGLTAHELTRCCPLTNEQIHRRIHEMARAGLLARPSTRVCTVTGRQALIIYLSDRALRGLEGGPDARGENI